MKNCIKVFIVTIVSFFVSFIVANAATFTMAECSEGNYIRAAVGSNVKLTDVDHQTIILPTNHKVEILQEINGWYKIYTNYYSNNYTGYINASYFKNKKVYTIDEAYKTTLRNQGFPESYVLPLAKLHAMYPKWIFLASKYNNTGLDWNTAVNNEVDPPSKSLIQNSSDKSLWSTDGTVYNAGNYATFEGYWHAASRQTTAFYMDSRNWLNYKTIFAFEQLSYNASTHTTAAVQKMLNGTFMQGSYTYNGKSITYAQTFVDAGKQYNVSPIQLASRALQEQGTSGSSTINMDGGDGKTYYNFFNVNVSGSNLLAKALATAKNNGWDSPYKSIMGGASLIANGYVKVGQDTNYYQRFNTISNTYGLYQNQYMTNVRVLPSEAYTTYKSYETSGLLDTAFTFKIPVYLNMPNSTTLSITKNGDTTLKALSVTGCTIDPGFISSVTNYSCSVLDTVTSVKINATPTSSSSTVTGTGTKTLNSDKTKLTVTVTAANGDVRYYYITVNKIVAGSETPSDVVSYMGYNNKNNILSNIPLNTSIAYVKKEIIAKFPTATIVFKDIKNATKTSGIISTGDTMTIAINGKTITYTLKIKGDVNGDGKIDISDLAMIKGYMLGKTSLSGVKFNAADINADSKIDISDLAMVKAHMLGKIDISK